MFNLFKSERLPLHGRTDVGYLVQWTCALRSDLTDSLYGSARYLLTSAHLYVLINCIILRVLCSYGVVFTTAALLLCFVINEFSNQSALRVLCYDEANCAIFNYRHCFFALYGHIYLISMSNC